MIYGRVYKIYCNITAECYYGSTKQTLSRRLSKHKTDYKYWKKTKKGYKTSYKIIERGNFTISLMEEGEFQNKHFMEARERHYIENNECVNKVVPTRTQKEYKQAHREQIAEYKKKNYEEHREDILEYHKEHYQAHRERINEKQKEHYQAHRERINEKNNEYREANRQQLKEQANQKHNCECGGKYTQANKARHIKTDKHLAHIAK